MVLRALAGAVAVMAGGVLGMVPAAGAAPAADCPSTVDCRFVPAAYDWSSADHSDPNNYGNYDPANRPADGDGIRYIVIHDTEESYDNTIKDFQNPTHFSTANYVIRSSDGQITQMVPNSDITWGVSNWTMNQHSISIEHEGFAAQGNRWYTEKMYESSAKLVRYLAAKYHIPLDRRHIIAHEDVAGETDAKQATQHWDPGPYWNWQHYMALLGAPIRPAVPQVGSVVTINPDFATNKPVLTSCGDSCTTLPAQGANFVYLRSAPGPSAPLLGDPLLHPGGAPGSTRIDDWSDKAVTGRQYVVAGRQGDWTAIWFDGQRAWFFDPGGHNTVPALAATVTARHDIPVYGRAFPDRSAYPASIPFEDSWTPAPLSWTIPAGQAYPIVEPVQASNYYARFDAARVPANHTLVVGNTVYLMVSYNHRYVWVKTSDL